MTRPRAHSMFTRREFLGSMAALSTAASMPSFLLRTALADTPAPGARTSSMPGRPDDRILVVIQLSGGNDGLNTIVPYRDDAYYRARPAIGIQPDQVLKLDRSLDVGLNPSMKPLKELYDQGIASIIQGVGYPNPNRSHFVSMDIWHTADPAGGRGFGWIGKALDAMYEQNAEGAASACISLGSEAPLATNGKRVKAVSFDDANLFRWAGDKLHPALQKTYDHLNRSGVLDGEKSAAEGNEAAFLMRTAMDAQVSSDQIRAAVSQQPLTSFPGGGLSGQLRKVASMIRAQLPTRVYCVTLGGFDTHAGQVYPHGRRLLEFSRAVQAFYGELRSTGLDSQVLTMAFSEFGRRVKQNASQGTDHGTAGPMFLFGPMVRPGVIGAHPTLEDEQLDQGDLVHTTDFRNVYAGILHDWLKLDSHAVLGRDFRPAQLLNAKVS